MTILWALLVIYATLATAAVLYLWPTIERLTVNLQDTREMAMEANHWLNVYGREVEELLKKQREGWHRDG